MSEIDADVWFGRKPQTSETDEQRIARERRERTRELLREDSLFGGKPAPERPADDEKTLWRQAAREHPALRTRRG